MTELPSPALVAPRVPTAGAVSAQSWKPVALRRAQIDQAIAQLLGARRTDDDLRRVLVVHPQAARGGTGLAPGIEVSIEALAPGETAHPPRRNSSALALQISGQSEVVIDGEARRIGVRDLYSVPPFAIQSHTASGTEPAVRIVFSNAALLEMLGAHHVAPAGDCAPLPGAASEDLSVRNDGRFAHLGRGDSWRLEYERVIDPRTREESGQFKSVFQVGSDAGRGIKMFGCILIVAGDRKSVV